MRSNEKNLASGTKEVSSPAKSSDTEQTGRDVTRRRFIKVGWTAPVIAAIALSQPGRAFVSGCPRTPDKKPKPCIAFIWVDFSVDCLTVIVGSSKDISNVVLDFGGGVRHKFDGLSGYFFETTSDRKIVGVWVKSGCYKSGDGPGYGEYFANPNPC